MADNIDRDKVEELISQNNIVQEKFILLQFTSINEKLDKLIESTNQMTTRQNTQEFAILSLEKEKDSKESTCPHKQKIDDLVTNMVTQKEMKKQQIVAISVTAAIFTILNIFYNIAKTII